MVKQTRLIDDNGFNPLNRRCLPSASVRRQQQLKRFRLVIVAGVVQGQGQRLRAPDNLRPESCPRNRFSWSS